MSGRDVEIEWIRGKVGSPPFGVGQGFFYSSIIQYLILIITENSVHVERAEADKVRWARREKKHIVQVMNHSSTVVFQAETKAQLTMS